MNNKNKRVFPFLLFYIIFLIVFVVVKYESINQCLNVMREIKINRKAGFWNANIIPLKTIKSYILQVFNGSQSFNLFILNIIGNVAVYIPFGFLLPSTFKKTEKIYLFTIFCISFITATEIFQFITKLGYFDVDDILLNFLGSIIGYAFYKLLSKIMKSYL